MAIVAAAVVASPATLKLSTAKAGAKNVGVYVTFTTELQCGQPRSPVTVTWPGSSTASIDSTAVRLNGQAAGVVVVQGHAVTVKAAVGEVMCQSIVVGPLKIAFARSAGLSNPQRPGVYVVRVRTGDTTASGRIRIRR